MNYRIIPVTAFAQNCSLIWCEQTRLAALVLRQFRSGADVIEVAMRQQNLHQRDASLRHHRFDTTSAPLRNWRSIMACRLLVRKKKMSSGWKAYRRKAKEDHMTRRMTWAVQHPQRHIPYINHIAFIEPAIRASRCVRIAGSMKAMWLM
jgi:hypothetical protein